MITESGCDAVTAVRVEYKQTTTDSWKSVEPDTVTTTHVTIDSLSNDQYEVRLVVINNENVSSTSDIKYVDLRRCEFRTFPLTRTQARTHDIYNAFTNSHMTATLSTVSTVEEI